MLFHKAFVAKSKLQPSASNVATLTSSVLHKASLKVNQGIIYQLRQAGTSTKHFH